MKRLSLALIAVGAFMVATVDFSPAFAGEDTTVAFSGPMCGGCIGKLTGCAKQVEGIEKLVVSSKDFGAKRVTAKVTFVKGADAEKTLKNFSKLTGFKVVLTKK